MLNNYYSLDRYIYVIISKILVITILILCVFPPLTLFSFYNQLIFLLALLWIFIAFLINPKYFLHRNKYFALLIFYVVYTFSVSYFNNNSIIGNRYTTYFVMFLFYIIGDFYDTTKINHSNIKFILFPFIALTFFISLFYSIDNPSIIRMMNVDNPQSVYYISRGVGGYEYIYLITFIACFLIFIFIYEKGKNLKKFIYLLIISLFIYLIILSNFLLALILVLLSVGFSFYAKHKNVIMRFIIITFVLMMFIFSDIIIVHSINFLIKYLNDGSTLTKLIELRNNVSSDIFSTYFISARINTLTESLVGFTTQPLFGIVVNKINISNGFLTGFGQHSFILDTFALFGFFIGVINLILIFAPFMNHSYFRNKKIYSSIIIVLTLVFLLLDNAFASLGIIIYYMFPQIMKFKGGKV